MKNRTIVEAIRATVARPFITRRLPWRRIAVALAAVFVVICAALSAFASQLVLNSTGGTMTLGKDFVLKGSSVTSPPGTLSIDSPITSVGGSIVVTYTCTGGSFTFKSTNGAA